MNYKCFATIVIGSCQSGKTNFILELQKNIRQRVLTVNFDPTKNEFGFDVNIGAIPELEFSRYLKRYGPKNAIYAFINRLLRRKKLLKRKLSSRNVKYLFIEMPTNIEILFGVGALPKLIHILNSIKCNVCIAFLLDAQLVCDPFSFVGGYFYSMSNVSIMNVQHVNILTKCDLLNEEQAEYLNNLCSNQDDELIENLSSISPDSRPMTEKIFNLIRIFDYGRFIQFDISEKYNVFEVISILNDILGYIPRDIDEVEEEEEDVDNDNGKMNDEEEDDEEDGEEEYQDEGEEEEEENNENQENDFSEDENEVGFFVQQLNGF